MVYLLLYCVVLLLIYCGLLFTIVTYYPLFIVVYQHIPLWFIGFILLLCIVWYCTYFSYVIVVYLLISYCGLLESVIVVNCGNCFCGLVSGCLTTYPRGYPRSEHEWFQLFHCIAVYCCLLGLFGFIVVYWVLFVFIVFYWGTPNQLITNFIWFIGLYYDLFGVICVYCVLFIALFLKRV